MTESTPIRPKTRSAIIAAAFTVFSRDPGATLADVAARAGVGRATLHRHFPSRAALMAALARIAASELDDVVERATRDAPSYAEGLRRALIAITPLAERQLFLAQERLDDDPDLSAARADDRAWLIDAIRGAQTEGAFDPAVPPNWIAELYENLIFAAWTLTRDGAATPGQAADLAWRTLTTGLERRS